MKQPLAPTRVAKGDYKRPTRVESRTIWCQDGLAVTQSLDDDGAWVVTHVASGFAALRGFRNQRDAIAAAKEAVPLGDWTVARTRLSKSLEVAAIALRAELRRKGVIS